MVRKRVYHYKYMDSWGKVHKTSLPDKNEFYGGLNIEDFEHAKRLWKHSKLKIIGVYHDLYVENDVLLLPDLFENFRNKCIEIFTYSVLISTRIIMAGISKKN